MEQIKLSKFDYYSRTLFEGTLDTLFDGDTTTKAFAGWNNIAYKSEVVINFRGLVYLEKLRFYDGQGSQVVKIETSNLLNTNEKRVTIFEGATDKWNTWREYLVGKEIKFIFLSVISAKEEYPAEFEFYGEYITPKIGFYPFISKDTPTISKDKLGICSGNWIDPKLASPFKVVRLWHEVNWVTTSKRGEYRFDNGQGLFNGTKIINDYKALGIKPILVLQNSPIWLLNGPNSTHRIEGIPTPFGSNLEDINSYKDISEVYAAYAKYFKDGFIYEIGNEPDKTWQVKGIGEVDKYDAYYTPFEYGAYVYSAYKAIKTACPEATVTMAGLAHMDWRYILAMYDWFVDNTEEKTWPKGLIVNFHIYCNDSTGQRKGTKGISPEDYKLADKVKEFVSVVKGIDPTIKVINTEFGYDTNNSIQSPKIEGDKQVIQGVWNVRTFLQLALAGVDYSCIFNMADEEGSADTNNDWLFNESGIITSESQGWKPKKGYGIIEEFSDILEDKIYTIQFNGSNEYYLLPTDHSEEITINLVSDQMLEYSLEEIDTEEPEVENKPELLLSYNSTGEVDLVNLETEVKLLMNKYKLNKLDVGWKVF